MKHALFAAALLVPFAPSLLAQDAEPKGGCEHFPMKKDAIVEIVGDSIGGPHDIFPMMKTAYPDRNFWTIGASIGGNTLRDAVGRMNRDIIRTDLGPDRDVNWYIIMFGANDSGVMDAAAYEQYYRTLIRAMKRRTRAHVILVANPAFTKEGNWYEGRTRRLGEFLDVINRLGAEYGLAVVDLYHPAMVFAKEHGNEAFAKDGIHPTPAAHQFMAQTFFKRFSFYELSEIVTFDRANNIIKSSAGARVRLMPAGGGAMPFAIENLYDFEREIGLKIIADGMTLYDDSGNAVPVKDGLAVVTIPCGIRVLAEDLAPIRATADARFANVRAIAQRIDKIVADARTIRLRFVPAGRAVEKRPPEPAASIYPSGVELLRASLELKEEDEATSLVKASAQRFVDQFADLRVNFPKERLKVGAGGVRDMRGIGRGGDAAASPNERFEVIFTNLECPSLSGDFELTSLPAEGWSVNPVGETVFRDLKRSERVICEFELIGEPVGSCEGEMVLAVNYELDGVPQKKDVTVRLFAPWLGAGTFCEKAELNDAPIAEKFAVAYEPEKSLDAGAVYKRFDGTEIRWKAMRSFNGLPGIDRASEVTWTNAVVGSKEAVFTPWQPSGVFYIVRWVWSPDDRDAKLLPVFCSRAAKLWVGDDLVVDLINPDEKEWHEDKFGMNWNGWLKTDYIGEMKLVEAKLKKGWNRILFKGLTSARSWNATDIFDVRFLDAAGKPFSDLLGACVPPGKD